MRDKQPPATNLPTIEDTNQSRTVKMPTESKDCDLLRPSESIDETLSQCGLRGPKEG